MGRKISGFRLTIARTFDRPDHQIQKLYGLIAYQYVEIMTEHNKLCHQLFLVRHQSPNPYYLPTKNCRLINVKDMLNAVENI